MAAKAKITREEIAGHLVLIVDEEWASIPRTKPLVEGTPDQVRRYCEAHPKSRS